MISQPYFRFSDSINPDVWFEPTEVVIVILYLLFVFVVCDHLRLSFHFSSFYICASQITYSLLVYYFVRFSLILMSLTLISMSIFCRILYVQIFSVLGLKILGENLLFSRFCLLFPSFILQLDPLSTFCVVHLCYADSSLIPPYPCRVVSCRYDTDMGIAYVD